MAVCVSGASITVRGYCVCKGICMATEWEQLLYIPARIEGDNIHNCGLFYIIVETLYQFF